MNETVRMTAIMRRDDDENGLMAAGNRTLVACTPEGVDLITALARIAWPNADLIYREFDMATGDAPVPKMSREEAVRRAFG